MAFIRVCSGTALHCAALNCAALNCAVCCTAVCHTALLCAALLCTSRHCTLCALCCNTLHCAALHCATQCAELNCIHLFNFISPHLYCTSLSGTFRKGMKVGHSRMKRTINLSSAQALFAQDRESITEAFPGDVIGTYCCTAHTADMNQASYVHSLIYCANKMKNPLTRF